MTIGLDGISAIWDIIGLPAISGIWHRYLICIREDDGKIKQKFAMRFGTTLAAVLLPG
jgi:hypothetical protein